MPVVPVPSQCSMKVHLSHPDKSHSSGRFLHGHWKRMLMVFLLSAPAIASEPQIMTLEGDVSAIYTNGDFVAFLPQEARGGTMAMSTSSKPTVADKPTSLESTLDVIGKAEIGGDGRFTLEIPVKEPRRVSFYILNAFNSYGTPMAPAKGNKFILEPGQLSLTMSRPDRFIIQGGRYNDAVYNTWRESEPYLAAEAEHERLLQPVEGESETARRSRIDQASAMYARILELENEGRSRTASTHPDPVARRLAIETAWLIGPWVLDALRAMAELTPDDPWVIDRLAREEKDAPKRAELRKRFSTGAIICEFTAVTLDGEKRTLAKLRENSRYVLLEYWASWCGPCRLEIPHMKEAYARFSEKGFEIVSFTIDDDWEDWELASREENLPWIDLGFGTDAEAARACNVTGVPKNFLFDSKTGSIVATDLRGHHLDEKLEELFSQ